MAQRVFEKMREAGITPNQPHYRDYSSKSSITQFPNYSFNKLPPHPQQCLGWAVRMSITALKSLSPQLLSYSIFWKAHCSKTGSSYWSLLSRRLTLGQVTRRSWITDLHYSCRTAWKLNFDICSGKAGFIMWELPAL